MAILSNFSNIMPLFKITHEQSQRWMALCHEFSAQQSGSEHASKETDWGRLFQRFGVKETQISTRWSECPDVLTPGNWEQHKIYNLKAEQPSGVDIEIRNRFFSARAKDIFSEFYSENESQNKSEEKQVTLPNHLIHVTCTGYVSPSAAQLLVAEKSRAGQVDVTHAYHMGCYAALPAIRMAAALSEKVNQVDIVHTEMCTLHMNPALHTPEQMVVQSLFADGHSKYSITKDLPTSAANGFRLVAVKEWILMNSADDMSWMPAAFGMHMTLSREVPAKITAELRSCLLELLKLCGLDPATILRDALFAIHPGGPKIIEAVESCLELQPQQTTHSHEVLRTRGNMSSATLPHIWGDILKSKPAAGQHVVSFAFGPGLTIFASVFEIVNS